MLLIIILLLGVGFQKATKTAQKLYLEYAKIEVEKVLSTTINNSVTDEALKELKNNNLYNISKNQNGDIEMIDYDAISINLYQREVTSTIEQSLENLENKTVLEIPMLSLFDNPLINNLGPTIKVRVKQVGKVDTQIMTEVKQYGINNSLIEMFVYVEVKAKVILPIISEDIIVTSKIPISYKIVTGKIPYYYGGAGIFGNFTAN